MGTFAYMLKFARDIELSEDEINPNEEEQLLELTQTVTAREMHPHAAERDIYRLIESHPLHPIHHRPLTRYSREERELRRNVSERIRTAMAEYMIRLRQQQAKYKTGRYYGALLSYSGLENDPHNEEVSRLFAQRTAAEEQEFRRILKLTRIAQRFERRVAAELAVENEINVEYPRRRAEFIMRRIDECVLRYELDIRPLMADGADINDIADKFNTVMEISSAIMEIDNFLKYSGEEGEISYISFTDEEKQKLRDIKDSYQPVMTCLHETLAAAANPCYEFINPAELADYDCTGILDEYRGELMGNYLNPVDSLTLMLDDRLIIEQGRDVMLLDNLAKIKQRYDLRNNILTRAEQPDATQPFVADDAVAQLRAGHPIAVSRGDDIIIVARTGSPDSGELTVDTPMEYFNHYFGVKKIEITEQLIEADPFYIRSSPEFRAMRRTLEQVVLLPDLAENASAETKQHYRRLFETLAEQASLYYDKKTGNLEKYEGLNKRERKRAQFAKNVENFARMKIGHLEMVDDALLTTLNYERTLAEREKELNDPEFIEQQALENEARERQAREQQAREQQAHEKAEKAEKAGNNEPDRADKPLDWLEMKTKQYAADLPSLANALNDAYHNVWMSCEDFEGEIEPYGVTHEALSELVGAMIAAELVGEEKKALDGTGTQGVRETLLCGESGDRVRAALGHEVISAIFGHKLGEEYYEDTKEFMKTFDPAKSAADIKGTFEEKFGVSFLEKLATKYRDTIKPMRGEKLDDTEKSFLDWTCKNIIEPGCRYCAHFAGNEENIDYLAANRILASCVLHNMVQLERVSLGGQAPGRLEKMLADPDTANSLQQRVMTSHEFEKMTDELGLGDLDGNAQVQTLPQAIENQLPRRIAESIFKTAFAEQVHAEHKAPAKNSPVKEAPNQPTA